MGIGIHVPSLNINLAEGLVQPPSERAINWAELSAIKRALELLGPQRPVIHTDSQWCAKILEGHWVPTKYKRLVSQTRKLVKKHGAGVVWIPRTKNTEADALAKWASGYYRRCPYS